MWYSKSMDSLDLATKIVKLPRWAQDHIEQLTRKLAYETNVIEVESV